MPLFHIHGLIAGVTASVAAGASIWCAPGFDALKFFGWMKEAQPTWYTAVPTMHQAILSRAGRNIAHEAENGLIDGTGEVVISGPNVTPGYESNPEANEKNFFEFEGARWFRTGDQGAFDDEGYLHLTGRLKEIINRGGEKISPLEVDGVLLDHPDVTQVVTFALPHPKLG